MACKLQNYLRTHRKHTGLSQDEVAFLLGCQSGTKVSRYERFIRQPTLETAFAYEALFGVPARELFAGTFQKVEKKTIRQAQLLTRRLDRGKEGQMNPGKLQRLEEIALGKRVGSVERS